MAEKATERIIKLIMALVAADVPLTREQIRHRIDEYSDHNDWAFQRMFERDKEMVRDLGISLLAVPMDSFDDVDGDGDELGRRAKGSGRLEGYRIASGTFLLPDVQLTSAEAMLVALATSVWNVDDIASSVRQAVTRLRAGGVHIDQAGLGAMAPRVTLTEPSVPILWDALTTRTPVRFTYHDKVREVNPWYLMISRGATYLICEMRDGSEPTVRMFKVDRMQTVPLRLPGTYPRPDRTLIDEKVQILKPPNPTSQAIIAVRAGAGQALRSRSCVVDRDGPDGYDVVSMPYASQAEAVSALVRAGADALVLEPDDLRQAVMDHLRRVVGGAL